jgi:hypothetical protein
MTCQDLTGEVTFGEGGILIPFSEVDRADLSKPYEAPRAFTQHFQRVYKSSHLWKDSLFVTDPETSINSNCY